MRRDLAFVGRAEELAALRAAVDRSVTGVGTVVVVEGDAGIGKTTLVDQAVAYADRAGVAVFRGRAWEMETHRPFGLVTEALGVRIADPDPAHAAIAGALAGGGLGSEDWPAAEFRVVELLLTLLDEMTSWGPAVLVAEDLHWADVASLVVLSRVAAAPQLPLGLVMTVRPQPRRAELAALLDSGLPPEAVRIGLDALAETEWGPLTESLVGGALGPRLREYVASAGGNPLFIREIVGGLMAEGVVSGEDGGVREIELVGAGPSFAVALFAHLSALSRPCMELLGVASVLGSTFSVGTLSRLTGDTAAALWGCLGEALAARVLVEDGDRLAFRHALIHDAFYFDLPAAVRAALHADAARTLGGMGAVSGIVAEHLIRSGPVGSPEARAGLRQAAVEVAGSAPAVAVELFEAALAVTDEADPSAVELQAELALALAASGRHLEAETLARRLIGDLRAARWEAALRGALIQSLVVQGRLAESVTESEVAAGRDSLTPAERARFAARAPLASVFVGDWEGAIEKGRQVEAVAVAAGDVPAQVLALGSQASVLAILARWSEATTRLARAITLTEADGTRASYEIMAHQTQTYVLADLDQLDRALALGRLAQRNAETLGTAEGMVFAHLGTGYALFLAGDWEDALAANEVGTGLSEEMGLVWHADTLAFSALMRTWRGEVAAARSLLDRAQAKREAGVPTPHLGLLALVRSVLEEAAGRPDHALATLLPGWEQSVRVRIWAECRLLGPPLARAAAAAGRFDLAAEVADRLCAQVADNPGVTSILAAATLARALADQDDDALLEALALHRDSPRLHETARCAEGVAGALARTGRQVEARTAAEEALELYGQLRADGEVARATAAFRRDGLRFGSRGRRRRPVTGWAALTDTEQRVARRAAERMTNPQIAEAMYISRRTVDSHISHLLAKLGMTSRTELIAAAARGPLEEL